MKKFISVFAIVCLFFSMAFHVSAFSGSTSGITRGFYMSSANVYATVDGENDVIGRAVVPCLSKVAEIDVDMYLQRSYGNAWRNATSAYNINKKDLYELDESAIIYNVTPGTYRVYIEVTVIGYDGLMDSGAVGTGSFTILT